MKIGKYQCLDLIGKGGMGSVYRAREPSTGHIVAIKLMAPELVAHPTLLRRFEQECTAALRLQHPNVVQGLDFGVEDGRPFLVMEYVEGESLSSLLMRGPMAEGAVVSIGMQVAEGLAAAHALRLVHRDVKPDNILLAKDGTAKVTDLGLVKDLDGDSLTRTGTWVGTITYMAPEQFGEAKSADGRCDIYALAATLYHALTGQSPFPQGGSLTVLSKKLANEFVAPAVLMPNLSPQIDQILRQALNADPSLRPATCAAFREALLSSPCACTLPLSAETELPERRDSIRFPVSLQATVTPLRGGQDWPSQVRDVSLKGIRLCVSRRFESASVLRVAVRDARSNETTYMVRVCWVQQKSAVSWEIGCAFARALAENDLDVFLGQRQRTIIRERPAAIR